MKTRHLLPALAFWMFFTLACRAQVYYVDANSASPTPPYATWSTAAATIQNAVNAAGVGGGTVLVTNGIYQYGGGSSGGSNRVSVTVGNLTIQSVNGPAVTVIMGYQLPGATNGVNAVRGVYLQSGSVLSGFTVTGGATYVGGFGGGVYGTGTTAVVTNCVISGNAAWDNAGGVYNANVANCVITGNTAFQYGGGAQQCTLNSCIISSNRAALGGGGCYNGQLNHCLVSGNLAVTGAGVGNSTAYDSLFTGNGTTNNSIVNVNGGAASFSTLINCTVTGNSSHTLGAAEGCGLANCVVYYNNNGAYADCYQCQLTNCCTTIGNGNSSLPNNSISNAPGFINLAAGNYRLQIGSPCIDAGNNAAETNSTDLDGNPRVVGVAVDMGAYESQYTNTVLYVSLTSTNPVPPYTNWLTAATNIEAAVSVAQPGNVVVAGPGVYTNDNVVIYGAEANRVAVTNGITLMAVYGPSATLIVGTTQTRCAYVDGTSVISGFTITNGHGSLTGNLTNEQSGGGIWCQPGGAVVNCLVVSNFAGNINNFQSTRLGGGVYGGTVSNCTLLNNLAGSGGAVAGNATLWNCLLAGNTANSGGGAYRSVLYNCIASNNYAIYNGTPGTGGGISQCVAYNCLLTANPDVSINSVDGGGAYQGTNYNCTISGNFASSGGGTYLSTNINCFISGNVSSSGGGSYGGALYNCVLNGNVVTNGGRGGGAYVSLLVNCTVTGNSAAGTGSSAAGAAEGSAYNSIIYFNNAINDPNQFGVVMRNCCTTPLSAPNTDGNITNNPLFVDAAGGAYQLGCGSPCIDAGISNAITPATTNDIRGVPRPLNGIDLGAYEYNPATDETTAIRPAFSYSSISTYFSVPFVAQISGCPDYYWWDFGDGTTISNLPAVSHAWTSPGTFTITLNAYYSGLGRTISATTSVQVVQQPVYYVNVSNPAPVAPYTNWAKAATSIQQAIGAGSTPGRLVLVTNGIYTGAGVTVDGSIKNLVALTNSVFVQSVNGPQVTTVVQTSTVGGRVGYVGTNSFLSGFTIAGGNTLSSGDTNKDESGAGIWCEPGGVVSNCVVSGNSAYYNGGGAFQGTYYNCIFSNNIASYTHGQGCGVAYATLYNCLITSNSALNSAYGVGACQCTLYNCVITRNGVTANDTGAGVASCTLYNCVVSYNLGGGSGGGGYASTLWNCFLTGNSAYQGGGANNCTLYNCTVAGNTSNNDGGGMYGGAGTNCIIYDNVDNDGSSNSNWISSHLDWSCTAPLPGGTGNTAKDPVFVNAPGGNFHLQATSPAINSGNNAFVYGVTDLDGNPRIMGGTVDMGAYEFQSQVTGTFDAWLAQYGLPTDGSADNVDSDGTGMLNWQKWIAGLNPTNPASVLAMMPPAATNNSAGVTISWLSVNNRTYFIQRATDLSAPSAFSIIQNNIPGQSGATAYTDTTATGLGPYFYRVGVQ